VVHRLNAGARAIVRTHLLALPVEDRRLRFGGSLSVPAVAAYVEVIDVRRDEVFVVFDDALEAVGIAHVALGDAAADLGISILPRARGRGAGTAMVVRAAAHARNRLLSTLFMHCLAENTAIMHNARKSGMSIVTAAGDVDAHLALLPASVRHATTTL
jgi:ribosomal protein S18 acetylase RimI-like enzyme